MNNNHGGAGRGQGRKPKYSEKTKTICFRVPESKETEIKKTVYEKLKEYETAKTN